MLTTVNHLEELAAVRLLEFLSDGKPWNRSLWGIGVVLAMDELFEACAAMRQGHLSEGAVKRMTSALQKRIGVHPAFSQGEKQFLKHQLLPIPRAEGAAHYAIRDLANHVSADYLTRWGREVAARNFTVEHFARSVAAHLLDAGFAGKYLHHFIKARLDAPEPISLPELCDALQTEVRSSPKREFDVLLAFGSIPPLPNGIPPTWL